MSGPQTVAVLMLAAVWLIAVPALILRGRIVRDRARRQAWEDEQARRDRVRLMQEQTRRAFGDVMGR